MANVLATWLGLLLVFHVVVLALLLRNQRWMAWPPHARHRPSDKATVTAIVPARNEAADIGHCLRSLLAQDYSHFRVIAINDHSDDDTPRIIDEIAAADSRLIAIHDPPLKPGWLGKHNAMQAALEHVESDLVLLTDADVIFSPACLSAGVGELEERQLDFLTLYPQFHFVSFCETLLVPFYVGGAALLLSPAIENPRFRHAMAVGAFILLRTDRLRQIGGFEPIKAEILDDVVMARTFKGHGFKIGLRSARDLMHLRFFKSNRHAFFGCTKHLLGTVQDHIWLAPLLALAPLLMYGTLLFGTLYGLLSGQYVIAAIAILSLTIHYVALLLTRPGNKFNALLALAFPLMAIPFAASCLRAAYLLAARGTFEWRGRSTDLRAARQDIQ
jgi:glycosyltransferase involved in cell wall biosynthesis